MTKKQEGLLDVIEKQVAQVGLLADQVALAFASGEITKEQAKIYIHVLQNHLDRIKTKVGI